MSGERGVLRRASHDVNAAQGDQKMSAPSPWRSRRRCRRSTFPVGGGHITMVPFAKSVGGGYGINAGQSYYQPTNQIVDFYVEQTHARPSGRFRVNFEDVEQGADHDMDAIARYEYTVSGGSVDITVTSEYAAGGIIQHMGYVVSGTHGRRHVPRGTRRRHGRGLRRRLLPRHAAGPAAGWHVERRRGAAGRYRQPGHADVPTRAPPSGAGFLKDPLYYAAKWGGFNETKPVGNGTSRTCRPSGTPRRRRRARQLLPGDQRDPA